jgi:hypothetical protein
MFGHSKSRKFAATLAVAEGCDLCIMRLPEISGKYRGTVVLCIML